MLLPNLDITKVKHDSLTLLDDHAFEKRGSTVYVSDYGLIGLGSALKKLNVNVVDNYTKEAEIFSDLRSVPVFVLATLSSMRRAASIVERLKSKGIEHLTIVVESKKALSDPAAREILHENLGNYVSVHRSSGFSHISSPVTAELRDLISLISWFWTDRNNYLLDRPTHFFRAKSSGRNRLLDAAAAVFDRMSSAGLRPKASFVIEPSGRSFLGPDDGAVGKLFGDVHGVLVPNQKLGFDFAVFIEANKKGFLLKDYKEGVLSMMSAMGWHVTGRGDAVSHVSMASSEYRLSFASEGHPRLRVVSPTNFIFDDLSFSRSDLVVVSPEATIGAVVSMLVQDGVFLVTCRDLANFPPNSESLWLLVASQARRFTSSIDGRGKQDYLRLLLQSAISADPPQREHDPLIYDAARHPEFFAEFRMSTTGYRMSEDGAVFRLRFIPQDTPSYRAVAALDVNVSIGFRGVRISARDSAGGYTY
jgi:hypothetical protein